MPFLTFSQDDFSLVDVPGEDVPLAVKQVTLSGNQSIVRVTGAAFMSFAQASNNTHATIAPFTLSLGVPGSPERYYADTRCKDSFDVIFPFAGQSVLEIKATWKGAYSNSGPPLYKPIFGMGSPLEVSVHETRLGGTT